MLRLPRLALLCFLFAVSTLSHAQKPDAPTATPSSDIVLFDFEGGNFDGWTLSGDCWDKQPATPKTFLDRSGRSVVSGIVGIGYLTTLHPTLGNTATGKAVSRDFTIDKPFLTFCIGGGNHPKEACLNLVVDGKVVRSETGSDSPDLRPTYWDVYALMGKTAHLEVVDATANQQRGYIMVDDCRLSRRVVSKLDWRRAYVPAPIMSPTASAVMQFFSSHLIAQVEDRDFDLPFEKFVEYRQQIINAMIEPDMDIKIGANFKNLSRVIYQKVDSIIANWKDANPELKSFLHGFAEVVWVRTHIYFDSELARERAIPSEQRSRRFNPHHIYTMPVPSTGCGGFTWMAAALSAYSEGRCKVVKIEGRLRGYGGEGPPDHSWNAIITPRGSVYFADPTHSRVALRDARLLNGKIEHLLCAPLDKLLAGLFVADRYAMNVITASIDVHTGMEKPTITHYDEDPYLRMPFSEWENADTRALSELRRFLIADIRRATVP